MTLYSDRYRTTPPEHDGSAIGVPSRRSGRAYARAACHGSDIREWAAEGQGMAANNPIMACTAIVGPPPTTELCPLLGQDIVRLRVLINGQPKVLVVKAFVLSLFGAPKQGPGHCRHSLSAREAWRHRQDREIVGWHLPY